jgi:hypothetical protein
MGGRHGRAGGQPVLAWALWMLVLLGLPVTPWLNQLARHAGRSDLGSDANTVIYGLRQEPSVWRSWTPTSW